MAKRRPKNYKENEICPVPGCFIKQRDIGFCAKHAQRFRRYGDPNYVTPEKVRRQNNRYAQPKLGKVQKHVYKKRFGRHEHRVVAEEKIGRKLLRGEIVHHIDGNKHNNHPDNLEITTQSIHINKHREELNLKRKSKNEFKAISTKSPQ